MLTRVEKLFNPEKYRQHLGELTARLDNFGNREWFYTGLGTLILLLLFFEVALHFWPKPEIRKLDIAPIIDMEFVEFQEEKSTKVATQKDLSDKIIEKDVVKEEINWENAVDPTFDMDQRFLPRFRINYSEEDYPDRARRSLLPRVTVNIIMLIGPDGKIQDLKIKNIRSRGDAHKQFEDEFIESVRKIILKQSRMLTPPYQVGGVPQKFIWETKFDFILK